MPGKEKITSIKIGDSEKLKKTIDRYIKEILHTIRLAILKKDSTLEIPDPYYSLKNEAGDLKIDTDKLVDDSVIDSIDKVIKEENFPHTNYASFKTLRDDYLFMKNLGNTETFTSQKNQMKEVLVVFQNYLHNQKDIKPVSRFTEFKRSAGDQLDSWQRSLKRPAKKNETEDTELETKESSKKNVEEHLHAPTKKEMRTPVKKKPITSTKNISSTFVSSNKSNMGVNFSITDSNELKQTIDRQIKQILKTIRLTILENHPTLKLIIPDPYSTIKVDVPASVIKSIDDALKQIEDKNALEQIDNNFPQLEYELFKELRNDFLALKDSENTEHLAFINQQMENLFNVFEKNYHNKDEIKYVPGGIFDPAFQALSEGKGYIFSKFKKLSLSDSKEPESYDIFKDNDETKDFKVSEKVASRKSSDKVTEIRVGESIENIKRKVEGLFRQIAQEIINIDSELKIFGPYIHLSLAKEFAKVNMDAVNETIRQLDQLDEETIPLSASYADFKNLRQDFLRIDTLSEDEQYTKLAEIEQDLKKILWDYQRYSYDNRPENKKAQGNEIRYVEKTSRQSVSEYWKNFTDKTKQIKAGIIQSIKPAKKDPETEGQELSSDVKIDKNAPIERYEIPHQDDDSDKKDDSPIVMLDLEEEEEKAYAVENPIVKNQNPPIVKKPKQVHFNDEIYQLEISGRELVDLAQPADDERRTARLNQFSLDSLKVNNDLVSIREEANAFYFNIKDLFSDVQNYLKNINDSQLTEQQKAILREQLATTNEFIKETGQQLEKIIQKSHELINQPETNLPDISDASFDNDFQKIRDALDEKEIAANALLVEFNKIVSKKKDFENLHLNLKEQIGSFTQYTDLDNKRNNTLARIQDVRDKIEEPKKLLEALKVIANFTKENNELTDQQFNEFKTNFIDPIQEHLDKSDKNLNSYKDTILNLDDTATDNEITKTLNSINTQIDQLPDIGSIEHSILAAHHQLEKLKQIKTKADADVALQKNKIDALIKVYQTQLDNYKKDLDDAEHEKLYKGLGVQASNSSLGEEQQTAFEEKYVKIYEAITDERKKVSEIQKIIDEIGKNGLKNIKEHIKEINAGFKKLGSIATINNEIRLVEKMLDKFAHQKKNSDTFDAIKKDLDDQLIVHNKLIDHTNQLSDNMKKYFDDNKTFHDQRDALAKQTRTAFFSNRHPLIEATSITAEAQSITEHLTDSNTKKTEARINKLKKRVTNNTKPLHTALGNIEKNFKDIETRFNTLTKRLNPLVNHTLSLLELADRPEIKSLQVIDEDHPAFDFTGILDDLKKKEKEILQLSQDDIAKSLSLRKEKDKIEDTSTRLKEIVENYLTNEYAELTLRLNDNNSPKFLESTAQADEIKRIKLKELQKQANDLLNHANELLNENTAEKYLQKFNDFRSKKYNALKDIANELTGVEKTFKAVSEMVDAHYANDEAVRHYLTNNADSISEKIQYYKNLLSMQLLADKHLVDPKTKEPIQTILHANEYLTRFDELQKTLYQFKTKENVAKFTHQSEVFKLDDNITEDAAIEKIFKAKIPDSSGSQPSSMLQLVTDLPINERFTGKLTPNKIRFNHFNEESGVGKDKNGNDILLQKPTSVENTNVFYEKLEIKNEKKTYKSNLINIAASSDPYQFLTRDTLKELVKLLPRDEFAKLNKADQDKILTTKEIHQLAFKKDIFTKAFLAKDPDVLKNLEAYAVKTIQYVYGDLARSGEEITQRVLKDSLTHHFQANKIFNHPQDAKAYAGEFAFVLFKTYKEKMYQNKKFIDLPSNNNFATVMLMISSFRAHSGANTIRIDDRIIPKSRELIIAARLFAASLNPPVKILGGGAFDEAHISQKQINHLLPQFRELIESNAYLKKIYSLAAKNQLTEKDLNEYQATLDKPLTHGM